MQILRVLFGFSILLSSSNAEVLKIGGAVQATGVGSYGKAAWDLWAGWVNSNSATTGYTVEVTWVASSSWAEVATNLTDKTICSPNCVDVFICPYGSGGSITAIGGVASDFTGPVMVWGGASDTIFTTTCYGKSFKCYGTFTTASLYMTTGLNAVDGAYTKTLTAALIQNANAFSASVCAGANATILEGGGGITVTSTTKLSEKASVPDADMAKIKAVIAEKPDIAVICGHNGFVEPIIKEFQDSYQPIAVIGTNTITGPAQTKLAEIGGTAECVMMPTQWAKADDADSIVGWTSTAFTAAMPAGQSTYHAASAAAAGIALTHAMNAGTAGTRIAQLTTLLSAVDTKSFYGLIKFNTYGNILKPMYTEQHSSGNNIIVAPAASAVGAITHPLSQCTGWTAAAAPTTAPTSGTAAGGQTGAAADPATTTGEAHDDHDHDDHATTTAAAAGATGEEASAAYGVQGLQFLWACAIGMIWA